jgi:hypothetical protein
MTMGIIFIYEWGHIGTPDGCATPSARLDPDRGVRRPPSRPTSPFLRPPKCRPSRSNSALIQITAWFRISRFWVTEVARKPVVREGRIFPAWRFSIRSVRGYRSTLSAYLVLPPFIGRPRWFRPTGPIVLHGTSHWISKSENYSEPHTGLWARMGGGDKLQ